MPQKSAHLTSYIRRDALDKTMFGFVTGLRWGLPNVSKEQAIGIFFKHYGFADSTSTPNIESEVTRYNRMMKEYLKEQRSHAEEESQDQREGG